jgi:hypothetical protein
MSFSGGKTFNHDVYDAYVRMMCGNPLKVVAKFALSPDEGGEVSGRCLIFARLFCNIYSLVLQICLTTVLFYLKSNFLSFIIIAYRTYKKTK